MDTRWGTSSARRGVVRRRRRGPRRPRRLSARRVSARRTCGRTPGRPAPVRHASGMTPRLDPALPLVWRSPRDLQLGGVRPVAVVPDPSPAELGVLRALASGASESTLHTIGAALGASAVEVDALLERLEPARALPHHRARDLGADRRPGHPLRRGHRHHRHRDGHRPPPQRAQPQDPDHRPRACRGAARPRRPQAPAQLDRAAHLRSGHARRNGVRRYGRRLGHVRSTRGRSRSARRSFVRCERLRRAPSREGDRIARRDRVRRDGDLRSRRSLRFGV